MHRPFAEFVASAAASVEVDLYRWRVVVGIVTVVAFGVGLAAVTTRDEGGRVVEGGFPPGDVGAQMGLAHLQLKAGAVEVHQKAIQR
jgi:hypothetical protein